MHSLLLSSAVLLAQGYAAPSKSGSLNIDTEPAPPPDKGPAGAANADRDPANLKYEIIAIVGSYAVWTLLTVILIVFVGKRLRRKAQSLQQSMYVVQMKTFPFMESSPVSPPVTTDKFNMTSSPPIGKSHKNFSRKVHKSSPSEYSISTVNSYDESHRAKNMNQLADLYAAVMVHDEEKEARSQVSNVSPSDYYTPVSPRVAPELAHLYSNHLPHPMAPTPVEGQFPEDAQEQQFSRATTRSSRATPLTIISELSTKASGLISPKSPRRPRRLSMKNQRISQPMGSADMRDAYLYSDSMPLSPRLYAPGPPPPPPPGQLVDDHDETESNSEQIHIHMQPQTSQNSGFSQSKDRRIPPSLALHAMSYSQSQILANGSQTSLPSRAPKALPFREVYGDASLRSAPPTKTTFVDRPVKNYGPKSAMRSGIVPSTPYSPYMPFTPMTPITPRRLATRDELKKKRKEERLKALDENDLVSDEGWGA